MAMVNWTPGRLARRLTDEAVTRRHTAHRTPLMQLLHELLLAFVDV
jgi:hypothetical protein